MLRILPYFSFNYFTINILFFLLKNRTVSYNFVENYVLLNNGCSDYTSGLIMQSLSCLLKDKKSYSCPVCEKSFSEDRLIKSHIKTNHPGKKKSGKISQSFTIKV